MGREFADECLLEILRTLLLDSLVLHVVGEDKMGVAHPRDVQGGEEEGIACHKLQEEGGGGTVFGVAPEEVGHVVGEVDVEVLRRDMDKVLLTTLVVVEEIDSVTAHGIHHLAATGGLGRELRLDVAVGLFLFRSQLMVFFKHRLVIVGGFEHGLVLQDLALKHTFIIYKVFELLVGGAAHVGKELVEELACLTELNAKAAVFGLLP